MGESNIFLRKQTESDEVDEDNPWDDTKLIKAYDKAMNQAKQKIMKKIQAELGTTNEEIRELLTDAPSGTENKSKKKKNKDKRNKSKPKAWKVGNACRAIFSEDGEEYEAEIIALVNAEWCTVRFVGYGNEEDVMMKELSPSLGKHVIQIQQQTADTYASQEEYSVYDEYEDTAEDPQHNGEALPHETEWKPNIPNPREMYVPRRSPLFSSSPPPPPPPPAPFCTSVNGKTMFSGPPLLKGDESLNAMLLSWYTCGYYTGYYQREGLRSENRRYH